MTKKELWEIKLDPFDRVRFNRIKDNWNHIAKPLDGMGRMETLLCQIGAIQQTDMPQTAPGAMVILCADNGIVAEGVSQSGQEVTLAVAKNMGLRKSSVCKMAQCGGIDVIPVDIGIHSDEKIDGVLDRKICRGTRNFLLEPAMTEEELLAALETGIRLVKGCKEKGYRLLATGEMGIGNTTTSAAITAGILGLDAADVTGRGAGLDDAGLLRKKEVIRTALLKYGFQKSHGSGTVTNASVPSAFGEMQTRAYAFEVLRCVGGLEIAGMCGVFMGGAMYHIPVIADGVISLAAALCAEQILPGTRDYILPSHEDTEPASRYILDELDFKGVIHAELALGEGTGAVMLFPLLDMALQIYKESSSFDEIGVEQYTRHSTSISTAPLVLNSYKL